MLAALVAAAVVLAVIRWTSGNDASDSSTAEQSPTETDEATTISAAPTTTLTSSPQLVASDASDSRYTVGTSPFTVQLSFTGLCWVEARRGGSAGEVLTSQAFQPGAATSFTENAIWIRLGYPPHATITVNGVPLPPIGTIDPFNIEITAAAPAG